MTPDAILAAHEAHVAAHGPDCGKGTGVSLSPCKVIYRAWLHFESGTYRKGPRPAAEREAIRRRTRRASDPAVAAMDAAASRRYAAKHRSECRERNAKWRANHPDRARELAREGTARYRERMRHRDDWAATRKRWSEQARASYYARKAA